MNIVDFIMIALLFLYALRGYKNGLLPTIVNFIGSFLIFVIAFYIKTPISSILYENLPFLNFAGVFKGVIAVNILFYEGIAYVVSIAILSLIFGIIKKLSIAMQKLLKITLLINIPCNILAALIGIVEGILYCFILLVIASIVNTTAPYVNESKYANIILTKLPIISNVTSNLTNSTIDVYNTVLKNKNNTDEANRESIEILMKYDILSYDSAKKLYEDGKLNIDGVEEIIEEYKES